MAEQLPKWADVSASPEFQAADSATREAMRMGYREKLAELSYLAGGDDAGVKQHLDGFDKFSKPGVFHRIADRVTGRPTAASAAAMGLSGASEAAAPTAQEIATASSPSMRMASSGLGRRTAQPSLMVGKFDAQADAAGAGQVAPFSKIGLAAIRDDVAANGINAGDRAITDPTSAVGRARKLAAQGLLGPQVRSPEQMGAEQKPEEQSWLGNAVDANKLLARGAVEGAGSIARAAVEVPGRIGDWYDSKTAYLGARLAGESDEQATLIADKLKASREGMRRDVIDPLAEKGGKILDYLLPIAENTKKETESDIFEGNPLKGEAPTLKQDASLHRVVMKMYQTLGQMAPIVLGGVLTAGAKGGMAAGGALGFAQAADEGGSEESKRIRDLPAAAMREIPLYKQYRAEGLSHEEAVLATSADAGRAASLVQGMLGSLDGLLFPGAGAAARKSIAKVALKDGAVQSMQEAAESAGSRTAASLAVGEKLDPERIGKGLYDDAALGAVTGKVIGGSQAAGSNAALKAEEQASAKFDASIKQGIADKVASTFGRPTPVTDGITVAPETKATSGSRSSNPVIQKNATVIQDEPVSADVLLGTRPKSPVDIAAHEAATSPLNDKPEPTQAQKEAGTYAKGHTKIAGLDIAIENPQGSVRKGVDADGKAWENTLRDHYGYVKGTIGNDKDAVDTFIKAGTQPSHSGPVFVVDQVDPKTGKLDEHKAIIGAANEAEARTIYQRNYAKDWNGLGAITQLPIAAFKSWVKDGAKREPLGDITGWKAEPKATASAPAKDTSLKPTATLAQAIRKFGGLPEKFARDLTGEPAMTANKMPGYRGLFHASGTDLSTLVHDGKLDAYLPPNLRSDVRDDSRPTDTDAAVAHIEAILRNGEAQTAKSYARTEAKQQRLTAAAQKQQVVAPIEKGDTQASADAISEAEYEHFKQTGEPGFGWMPGAETFADSLDANTIEQLDALLNLPESADERAAMRSMGFTEDEITETLGPDAAASAGTNQVPESASAASESAPASREAAPPAAEVTKTGDERARDAELFRKTKSRLIAAFTGKSGESFDDLSKTLTARANDKNDPQSKLAAEVLDNFDGWKGNYEQRQAFEKNRESANPNEAAAKALESAAAALREVGKPSTKPADNDFLSELFGQPSSQPAEPQQQQKSGQRGIAAIRAAIRSAIDSAIRERDDWSSRDYKANKKQVELRGDGPGNNAAMSVGSINESRRNKAIESINQEIAALGKLEKQVTSDSGATQVMAGMSEIMDTAKRSYESGNYPGSTVNDLFESILLDRLKFRGPGGKGSVTSNGLSKAALSAITEQTRPTLDLTNPTESKLRTDDAKQKRDAAEKAAKENAPSPEEFGLVGSNRAADVGAAAGQEPLFSRASGTNGNMEPIGAFSDIRPPKEDVYKVASALSNSTRVLGNKMVPIATLSGGVGKEVNDSNRVKDLAKKLLQPGAYFERLIVDDAGNVIEGQHRLDALKLLGATQAPAVVIQDFERNFPNERVKQAIYNAQKMPSDNVNRMAAYLAEIYADEKGDINEIKQYDAPSGFESAWAAGIKALNEQPASQNGDVAFSRSDTIEVDGKQRPRNNSNGKPIAATDEGIRNFWKWFAGSKVVDEQGRPRVVYHGTTSDINSFDSTKLGANTDAGSARLAFFFTSDQRTAESYGNFAAADARVQAILKEADRAEKRGNWDLYDQKIQEAEALDASFADPQNRQAGQNVLPVYLRIENPSELDAGGEDYTSLEGGLTAQIRGAKRGGQDGVIIKNLDDAVGLTNVVADHYAVFKPNQIKSATGNTGQFSPDNADIRFSREAPLWRSTLTEAIGKTSFAQAPADQWKAWLNANAAKLGVKKDEIEWSGVTDWLDLQKGKVTRDQVREFLDENGVKVTETMLGGSDYESFVTRMMQKYGDEWATQLTDAEREQKFEAFEAGGSGDRTKYGSYQLPGGENYRELLLTLPESGVNPADEIEQKTKRAETMRDLQREFQAEGNAARATEFGQKADALEARIAELQKQPKVKVSGEFKSSHWDQPNILAHIRFNERVDADGKRVLFIEEIQSDWGQEGKKKGFARSKEAIQIEFDKVRQQYLDTPRSSPSFAAIEQRMGELRNENGNGTPSAPFIGKTEAWVSLALKRMIRYAVDNGFDRIAMVNGEQSAERYDLSKSVDSISTEAVEYVDGLHFVDIKMADGKLINLEVENGVIRDGDFNGKPLDEVIGKDMADKVLSVPQGETKRFSGLDLKVGGEGMKAFYDRIVPQVANDVLKKLGGGKVGTIEIGKGGWDVYRTDERTDEPEIVRANVKTEALANDIASDYLGGHVKRAQGQQPGFDITDKMREHAAQGMPLFRRDEQQPATTNTHAADVIAKAAKTVNIPLDVYATPQEASAKLGIYIPSDVRGLHYRGRAALISSNITTPAMGEFVLWHELLHAGITQVAPRYGNEYNRIMQDMAARNSNIIKAARDWRNSYGAETIKRSMDAGLSQEQAEKRMRLMAIEEAIADLAGANVELKGWQQFVAKLQALLRSMGFDNLANWIEGKSNAEVLQLIARTRDEVTTQNLHLTTQVPAFARDEDDASYQRAYHGTPHKFDKFSLDKIGTGEGAQAYGHGLYFASKKEIAEFYRDALTSKNVRPSQLVSLSGTPLSELMADAPPAARAKVTSHIQSANGDMKAAKTSLDAFVDEWAEKATPKGKSDLLAAKEWMRKLANESATFTPKPTGALYQVDIPEDSEMLHWDKPLSEQSDEVKALANKYDYPLSRTGGDFQKWASSASGGLTINIRGPKDRAGLEKQASDLFKKNGIRGIKYLDGGSRNAGDGSYNYVVFDDKDVNIEAVHSRADTIEVDGKARARSNSNGKPIATTDEGLRNFWKWFGDSKAVDAYGKPLVVYHGAPDARFVNQDGTFKTLGERYGGNEPDKRAFWFSKDRRTASTYADDRRAFDYQNAEAGVVDAYIRLENPLIVDANGDYWRTAQRRGKTSDVIAEARAAGNDGAIVRDVKDEYNNIKGTASTTTYTVFSSNQIKSAVGNTGAFSPDNADIRFSRNEQTTSQDGDVAFSRSGSGDIFDKNATDAQSTYNGTEAVQGIGASVKNVIRQTANIARDKRGAALSFLGGRQIADIYSKDVPELPRYNEILQRMQAEQNEGSAVADSIIEKWRVINRKRPDVATQLSSLMHDSTLAQVDPDVSADNAELRKRWINLPQEAKDIYREARDAYVAHFEKVKAELIDRVERSALDTSAKNRTLASMREEFTKAMKGVYFPLARFGDYMVVVKDKAGVTQSVSMAETTNQAQALRAELLRAYPDYVVGAIQKKKEFNAERDGVSRGFMKDLVALINEEPDAQTRDSQLDAINQLWLSSLPDLSWAKSGIHRKGTPGYSNDAMRAFARNMFHGGYHLAKLRYGDRLGDTLAQMQETIDNKVRSNPEYSNVVAQSVVDEMNARHKHVMNPQNTPVANALTGLGFMWHMGLSPASAVVNLSQTALVAYPMLASKFGFGKAATMLLSLSADAVKGKNDLLSQLQGAEKDAYDRAVREGLIDITMAHDLAGVSQGKSGEFNEKQQRVMRVASVMFHEAEKFNRGVTFMSAYRLAVQSGVSDPYKLAHDLTFDSHFDYSSQNRPRVMQGPTARVVLLFKQYGQNMIYTLSRNTFKALQGDREAQKTLAGLLAMHGMFAGALGLPLMTTLLAAASAIGGSDDEPWDAQVALRNYLADAFGKDIGEVLAHGVFRAPGIKDAIGADISGRVGLDSMLIRMPQETLEGKKYYQALLETIAGPVFGIGGNIANGMQTMAQGNTLRGIEEMLPKSIKDPLKAYRYEQDGIQDKTGITIVDETTIPEEVAQFLGFSPARGMEGFEGKSAIKNQEALLTQRRRQLMQRYGKDAEEGDTADSLVAIQRWNIANPTMAIKGQDLLRSMREKAKRQAEAENGAYLSKKRRGLAELGEFANAE